MILQMLCVRDSAVGSYNQPFCVAAIGVAVRSFGDEVKRDAPDNQMFKHPEDFELFHIGSFDDSTGTVSMLSAPVPVARGKDYIAKGV